MIFSRLVRPKTKFLVRVRQQFQLSLQEGGQELVASCIQCRWRDMWQVFQRLNLNQRLVAWSKIGWSLYSVQQHFTLGKQSRLTLLHSSVRLGTLGRIGWTLNPWSKSDSRRCGWYSIFGLKAIRLFLAAVAEWLWSWPGYRPLTGCEIRTSSLMAVMIINLNWALFDASWLGKVLSGGTFSLYL